MLPLLFAAALAASQIARDIPVSAGERVVDTGGSFEAAALSWSAAGEVTVRVRSSDDGRTWSEWLALAIDDDLSDRSAGRYLTAITHFGAPRRYLEYSFSGPAERVTLTAFALPIAFNRPGGLKPAATQTLGSLPIRSRLDWGCPDGEGSRWAPAYSTVTHEVVHHTAGANSLPDWDTELRNIWYFHTFTNGWGDIGYNYLIDPNGAIYEGRAGGEGAIGAHFSCRNTNTVGIALLGTYSSVAPTDAALASLQNLLEELCKRNAIAPQAIVYHAPTGLMLPTIIGHRDGNTSTATCSRTECPGDVFYALLPSIRSAIAARFAVPNPTRRRTVRP